MRFTPRAGGVLCARGGAGGEGASAKTDCHVPNSGATIVVSGRVILGLDRLASPSALLAASPDRAADESALLAAMQLLLAQIESITDKPVRTRSLLASVMGEKQESASR